MSDILSKPCSLFFIALLISGNAVYAQEADPSDVSSVDAIIQAYYEVVSGPAGEIPDIMRDKTLHHPSAWIAIAGTDDEGNPVVQTMDLDGFYGENAPRTEGFFEWETDRQIRRSGNMVSVWSSYATSLTEGGEPYTRGVNTITLWFDGNRWWVMNWMFDTTDG